VATKLNAFVNQLPQQQQLVDETVMMAPTQLESSVNMFDDVEENQEMLQLNDQSGNQDDQEVNLTTNQDDQSSNKPERVDETVAMEMSPTQLESCINTFDEALQ